MLLILEAVIDCMYCAVPKKGLHFFYIALSLFIYLYISSSVGGVNNPKAVK